MNDGFAKIYGDKLLRSTLWLEPPEARLVFLSMLAIADADGVVDIPGVKVLANTLNLDLDYVERALAILEAADPDSRSPEEEGRRLVRLDGVGWRCVNYAKYREYRGNKLEETRKRVAKHRAKKKAEAAAEVTPGNNVTTGNHKKTEDRRQKTDPPNPPEGGGTTLRDVAAVFREVTGHDLPNDIDVSWNDRSERKPVRRMLDWCAGDLGKLRAKLQLLAGDNWLPGQGIEQWAKRIGTNPKPASGAAPAPTRDEYDPEARLV